MAVTQRVGKLHSDEAPLWLPRHDDIVVEQASPRPPDLVDGYTFPSRLTTAALGSRWKMATSVSTALAVMVFLAVLPSLSGAGIGTLAKLAFYQSWTLGLMMVVTARVRSITLGTVARYWLVGMFTVAMIASLANGPLSDLVSPSTVWITPVLEEILKAAPFVVVVFMGRRAWRHPGLSDLMLLGFAVGAGYAFHEEALWERSSVVGFDGGAGVAIPSVFHPDDLLVVGHAVWTSIIGLAIGLLLLHRRNPAAVLAGVFGVIAVVGDHMAANDAEGTIGWVRQVSFNGKLLAILFVAGVGLASILDHRRLAATGTRDHLFPDDQWYRSRVLDPDAEYDPLMPVLVGRYRRLRNGMHTTVDATSTQWPPRSEAHPAPLAELSRLGRAAGVPVGPGTSSSGWTPDPESPDGFRFVGASGFTAYVANQVFSEPVATVVSERSAQEADPGKKEQAAPDGGDEALGDVDFEHAGLDGSDLGASYLGASYLDDGEFDDVDLDGDGFGDVELGDGEFDEMEIDDADPSGSQFGAAGFEESEFGAPYFDDLKPEEELREQIVVAKSAENGATTTSVSTPKVRVEAMGWSEPPRSPLYCWRLALGSIGIGLLLALRGLTAGEPSTAILEPAVSLPDATNSPVLILGLVGAAAALVSIRGRNPVVLGAGWEVGPGEDRTSDRSDEREA